MYRCTRQITEVLGIIVDDRECEYFDIPMLQMVAAPIPYSPYGQGLPERLEQMQDARTQMLSAIRDHTELHAHPVQWSPVSSFQELPEQYKQPGAKRAGMHLAIRDDIVSATGGKPTNFLTPPPMSEALIDGEKIFHDELTERSGNPDVLQGTPPPGVTAGVSLQILSQNASARFGFAQQAIRDMQERLALLTLHCIADPRKVTPQDLAAVDKRYPAEVCSLFQQNMAMLEWMMDVDMQTGIGSARNKKQAEAMQAHGIVDPITGDPVLSTESLQDALDIDSEQEQMRNARARQEAQQAAAQQAMLQGAIQAQQPQPQRPANKPPGQNGNGRMQQVA